MPRPRSPDRSRPSRFLWQAPVVRARLSPLPRPSRTEIGGGQVSEESWHPPDALLSLPRFRPLRRLWGRVGWGPWLGAPSELQAPHPALRATLPFQRTIARQGG